MPRQKFEAGDKVIVVSNEDEQYQIATIIGYQKVGLNGNEIELVKYYGDDPRVYLCFSIIRPYSDELCVKLDTLRPIEQWNYLTHDHAQIKEKHGIKYKTFKCHCDSCSNIRHKEVNSA